MNAERTRFAPSPTGSLHIGGLRQALWCRFLAHQSGGSFILRIEDTDQKRLVEDGVKGIVRDLAAFGIVADEGPRLTADGMLVEEGAFGPYVQSARLERYRAAADELVRVGKAYPCFCSPERLEATRQSQQEQGHTPKYDRHCLGLSAEESARRIAAGETPTIRLRMPDEGHTSFTDAIRGLVRFPNQDADDPVLLKSDGFPTYHLAVVVDDHAMGITTVLRGEEWLPSTPKHLVLYEAFGWQPPRFAHTPLILNPDKSKLSKRQGDVSAVSFLERGYLPETILNFIATLGFNPKGDQELYSPQELQELFSLEQVKPSGAVLNMEKLDWMNRHYLREAPLDALARALGTTSMNDAERRALDVERSRATTLLAIADALPTYQQWQAPTLDALRWKEVSPEGTHRALHALEEWLSAHDDFSSVAALEHALREQIGKWDAPVGSILLPLRVALAGKTPSPSPFELLYVLGREESLRRLRACFSN